MAVLEKQEEFEDRDGNVYVATLWVGLLTLQLRQEDVRGSQEAGLDLDEMHIVASTPECSFT